MELKEYVMEYVTLEAMPKVRTLEACNFLLVSFSYMQGGDITDVLTHPVSNHCIYHLGKITTFLIV